MNYVDNKRKIIRLLCGLSIHGNAYRVLEGKSGRKDSLEYFGRRLKS
jgi:hypothetical protein